MKYQEYRNKMLKVRKVMDVFYRFRFVFLGVAVATAATITTLDLSKGNITDVSKFEISYTYGEDIKFSGSAFMGDVKFEFRRRGEADDAWKEETPRYVGEYEARARSEGNHGTKYSEISYFEIKPYETTINVSDASVDFGNEHPHLSYSLLQGDSLKESDVVVNYDSLITRTTKAKIDLSTIKVTDKDGVDVSSCYTFTTEDKDITFNKQTIKVNFVQESEFTYTGEYFSSDNFTLTSGTLFYDAHLECSGGKREYKIGTYNNNHTIKVVDNKGNDYSANYDIIINDNEFEIIPAPAVSITSRSLSKEYYDGTTFSEFNNPESLISISPSLLPGHHFKLIGFTNKDVYKAGTYDNEFEYEIVDNDDNPIDRTLYKSISTTFGKITIGKKPITITSCGTSVTFDNQFHSIPDYEKPVEGLIEGDQIIVNAGYPQQLEPTAGIQNVLTYTIKHGEDDVTDSYDITPIYKNIVITVEKLKFNFVTTPVTYDAQEHSYYYADGNYAIYDTADKRENAALLDESFNTLPDGWTYDVRISNSFKRKLVNDSGYKPTLDDIEVHIYDDSAPVKFDVGHYYNKGTDITFDIPSAYVLRRALEVEVKDYTKEYNNRTIGEDIVIDPNQSGTCVTYTGLASGDLPDVDFSGNASSNKNYSSTPYNLSLSYKVQSSAGANVTNNYDITFKNGKDTIDATINKRDIVVHPSAVSKTYNGKNTFTPSAPTFNAPLGKSLLGTEEVSIKAQPTGPYTTSSPNIGTYNYSLNPNDIVIRVNNQDVTNNYNIFIEDNAQVTVDKRNLTISNNSTSQIDSHIFYDQKPHGAFVDSNGFSKEITVQTSNANDTMGLINGHRLAIESPMYREAVGSLVILDTEDLNIQIYDESDARVTDNYNITHDSFYIDIVQTKITISPKIASKYFDGATFDDSRFADVGFNEYVNYTASTMQDLFDVTIESITNNNQLQPGHVLQLTKYTQACANVAIESNVGGYPFYYGFRIIDTNNGNAVIQQYPELSGIYAVEAPQGNNLLFVSKATFRISCNAGGKRYDGKVGVPPKSGVPFALDTDNTADAYISSYEAGPRVFDNFDINAQFDTGAYDPNEMWKANAPGDSYKFPVTITITNKNTSTIYAEDGITSIEIIKNKTYYDYTITKSAVTITTSTSSDGREFRKYTGVIASTDQLCFGTIGDYEVWENKRKVYTHPLNQVLILRNGVDVTSLCYTVTV